MINIIVVSEIRIYCEGLSQILAGIDRVNVICSCSNSENALSLIEAHVPDVVLLDMTMAWSRNLAQHIAELDDSVKIVALAVPYDEANILQCAEAGITGYVPREASVDELIDAVVGAANGECYCPPKIAECIIKKLQNIALSAKRKCLSTISESVSVAVDHSQLSCLTRRERQIVTLLSNGLSNKQIARDLSIEVSTVKNHVHNVLFKLDVKSRSQAISLLHKPGFNSGSGSLDLDPDLGFSSLPGTRI